MQVPSGVRYDLPVLGMNCPGCATKIETALNRLPGVKRSQASFIHERVWVEGNTSLADVVNTIENQGYRVVVGELNLPCEGIDCASCAEKISQCVASLPGVLSASFPVNSHLLHIRYIPGMITPQGIVYEIKRLGYSTRLPREEEDPQELTKALGLKEHRISLLRMTIAAPIAALFLLHMLFPIPPFSYIHEPWLQFLLASIAVFASGNIHRTGLLGLLRGKPDMNTLISMGGLTAYGYGIFQWLHPSSHSGMLTFDAAAEILGIILVGRHLEERARRKTTLSFQALNELRPREALRLRGGKEERVPVEVLRSGDEIVVSPGEKIPADGVVIAGKSVVDRSFLTGESLPIQILCGEEAFAGEMNQEGRLHIRVTRVGSETMLSQLLRLVEEAQATRAPIQRVADRISAIFVPLVLAISALTFLSWWMILGEEGVGRALTQAINVLIISCPCALGLATPTAIVVAMGSAARMGVLFKSAEAIETLAQARAFALDKTGTLTLGKPRLTGIFPHTPLSVEELLKYAASAELGNTHPLARTLVEEAKNRRLPLTTPEETQNFPGEGVKATIKGRRISVGTPEFVGSALGVVLPTPPSGQGTVIAVGGEGEFYGYLCCDDEIRKEAPTFIEALKERGITPLLLSGDRRSQVELVASRLGIPRYLAELKPKEKLAKLYELKEHYGVVGMMGDGINDAPALKAADVGIALGGGSDLAQEAGDIILVESDLMGGIKSLDLARKTLRVIRQNLAISFFYNLLAIPVAAGVLHSWAILLKPWMAAVAMAISDLVVIGNSLRLRQKEHRPSRDSFFLIRRDPLPTLPE